MTERTRLKAEDRISLILGEAAVLIGERGFYGFTIQELATRCGITNGGLLHYFGTKEKLLLSLLEDRDRKDRSAVIDNSPWVTGEEVAHATLKSIVDMLRVTITRNSTQPELVRLFIVLQAESMNSEHPAFGFFQHRQQRTLEGYSKLLAPHFLNSRSVARQLIATMAGLEQQWLSCNQEFDLVEVWDEAADNLFGTQ